MCGLAAILNYSNNGSPVERDELLKIRDAMVTRGPDAAGLWLSADRRVGLAHRRLSIIDLSEAGSQPMATPDGILRITYNGEIYNYKALRVELEKKGYRFFSNSDTEVLLYLYLEMGQSMVQRLRGMYAIALWDERNRSLFLARDPFGIKPLYVADNGKSLKVASQVTALLRGADVDTTAEPAGHVGFMLWGNVPEPYTLYKGIRAVPAGSSVLVDENGTFKSQRFFNLPAEIIQAERSAESHESRQGTPSLNEILTDSVRHHLVADVPVGVFLSSGLDSTTLTALASEVASNGLHSVTLGFSEYKGLANDETPFAERIARQYGTLHQTKWVSKADFLEDYERLMTVMDQPSVDGVNTYFVSKITKSTGLKVAISGLGGDEIFAGYPSFRQIPVLVSRLAPASYVPFIGKVFRWLSVPVVKHLTSPKYAGLLEYGGTFSGAYLLRRGLFMPWELPNVLESELVREGWRELQPLLRLEETVQGIGSARLKVSALELSWYMRNQLLRDSDWAGMAHSLEIRLPLVDIELWRKLLPLLLTKQPPGKVDMARLPRKALPQELLERRKTGFSIPVRDWLLQGDQSRYAARGLRAWALTVYRKLCKY